MQASCSHFLFTNTRTVPKGWRHGLRTSCVERRSQPISPFGISSRSSVLEPFRSRRKRSPSRAHTRRNPGGGSRFIISTSGRSTISPVFFVILHVAHTCFPHYPLFNAYRSLITCILEPPPRRHHLFTPSHSRIALCFLKPWNTVLYYLLPAISPSRKTGAKISKYDTVMPI